MATLNLGRVQPIDRGIYDPLYMYKKLDFVTNTEQTAYYTCIQDVPSAGTPLTNTLYFRPALNPELTGTPEATPETVVKRDASGTAKFSAPTDPAHPLRQEDILGTVSATGTYPNLVPTGAIMESGSNANGEYVKYADGNMICRRTVSGIDLTTTIPVTASSFPVNFSEQPHLFCSSFFGTSDPSNFSAVANIGFVHAGADSLKEWRFAKSDAANGAASSASLLLTAIGRWK